ncbi:ligand-binding sensor domain-containing protein [Saonia flava]|nr:sensor histidine kinase [Saonia flava]
MAFFLFFPQNKTLYAQLNKDTLRFEHIKTGMSHSTISKIFEDSQGFLWVGTENGLNKYDGTDFQVYEKSLDGIQGLTNANIESIYEDTYGNLYIGTGQGLSNYDRQLNIVKPYPFKPEGQHIQSKLIRTINRTGDFLWLGTYKSGLYRYNILTGETSHLGFKAPQKGEPDNNEIIETFELPNNKLFVVTQGSRYIIDFQLQIKEKFEGTCFTSSVHKLDSSKFLLGFRNGNLLQFNIFNNQLIYQDPISISPGHTILTMEQDVHGNIWLGTENDGLWIYTPSTGNINNFKSSYKKPGSISNNSIWSLHKARNGVMWMGYFKKGLSFYDSDYYKFGHIKTDPFNSESLSNDIVHCFSEDKKGNIWIGTDGGGLNYWNRKTGSFEHYSLDNGKLNSNVVISMLHDDQNRLWVGSWGHGLTIFDLNSMDSEVWTSENSFLASNNIKSMLQDKKGRIWIAAFNGRLQVYYPETKKFKDVSIQSEKNSEEVQTLVRLHEDDNNYIWVGTATNGLFRIKETNNGWTSQQYHNLSKNRVLSDNNIKTIVEDDQGTMWVGTQGGLNKYLPTKDTFKAITKSNELKSDVINGIVEDEYGFLWLSTGMGIVRYNDDTGEFINYDIHDGLQGNEFNDDASYRTADNEILFGGNNGFNILKADKAEKRTDQPKVVISGLKIFNKRVKPNDTFGVLKKDISQVDSITLRPNQSVINFEFNALTFRNAKKVNYAYFLQGFEEDWNYVGHTTTATYTNLNPGTYLLRIKSTNSDGVWNNEETSLFITITPPFWKTWWFRSLLIACIILGGILFYKIRVRSMKKDQAHLEQLIHDRTKELQLQKKKLAEAANALSAKNEEVQRFTYAVSHDLKTPLNNIKGIASILPMEFNAEDTTEMEKCLELIDTSCNIMSDLISDITEIARLGTIENKKELLDANQIMMVAKDLVSAKLNTGNVKLHIQDNLPSIYGDRNRIIQVFGNLLDNAIKYMGDQKLPTIHVKAYEIDDSVKFQVIDNGSGMDKKSLKKLFLPFQRFHSKVKGTGLGLYMIKKIIESHNGQITVESEGKGLGTSFSITLPKAAIAIENSELSIGALQSN